MNKFIGNKISGKISEYYVVEELNDGDLGANGILLKVKETTKDVFYVAKILNNSKKINRFVTEYTLQGNTSSPFIVKALDTGRIIDGKKSKDFYIMNLYECNYRRLITKGDSNYAHDYCKRLKYILDICEALKYIHLEGNFHRDLKPENILFDKQNDRVLLGDFGLVYVGGGNGTTDDTPIGNFDYHAPEQKINGAREFGSFTDIYALGLIINETFTGEIPSGTEYITIGQVYKPFAFLDKIVSRMIIQDYTKRLSDIREVIDCINDGVESIKEYEEAIYDKIKLELIDNGVAVSDDCKKQIYDDVVLANSIFDGIKRNDLNEKTYKNINYNYHCNIAYNTKQIVYNSFVTYRIYHIIYEKFLYESETDINLAEITELEVKKEEIGKIKSIFKRFEKVNMNFRHFAFEGVRFFLALKNYHIKEVFERINRELKLYEENLMDAPLLWIYFFLDQYEFVKSYYDYYPSSTILDLVDFNQNNFSNEVKMDNLYNDDFQKQSLQIFASALKGKYPSSNLIDNEYFEMNSIDADKFIGMIDKLFVDDGSVQCGDVLDFRKSYKKKYERNIFKMESWQLSNVNMFLKANKII